MPIFSLSNHWRSPLWRFAGPLILGMVLVFIAIYGVMRLPYYQVNFEPGWTLQTQEHEITIQDLDLSAEPGDIVDHQRFWQFFERQDELFQFLKASQLQVTKPGGAQEQHQAFQKEMTDIPFLFWIQAIVGFGALAISLWLWSLRRNHWPSRFFAGSGLAMFLSALSSAVYTTRELALPSHLFRWLVGFNVWGASFFGVSMVGLFLVYPLKLKRARILFVTVFLFFTLWTFLYTFRWVPEWANMSLIILSLMMLICLFIGIQFWITRGFPRERASLTWLGLAVLLGAGAFVAMNTLPLLLGLNPLHQGYAFLSFLVIYLGIAAGISRYRLFEVGDWAFRFLFYAVGALCLVSVDALLISLLGMNGNLALGFSLLMVGFLYLPLRDFLRGWLYKRQVLKSHEVLPQVLNVVFAPSRTERGRQWKHWLQNVFDPLEVLVHSSQFQQVVILEEGLSLGVPSLFDVPALQLRYPKSGRGLYSLQDRDFVQQMIRLVQQAESQRESYDRGVLEERRRMAQDLHDDLGARLLQGLYSADEKHRPSFQAALADVRAIVGEMSGDEISLDSLLSQVRQETLLRCADLALTMNWSTNESFQRTLNYRQQKTLRSAFREILSNVIRHAQAQSVDVRVEHSPESFCVFFRDDGGGFEQKSTEESTGYGLKNLRQRIQDLRGELRIKTSSEGTEIYFSIPFGEEK